VPTAAAETGEERGATRNLALRRWLCHATPPVKSITLEKHRHTKPRGTFLGVAFYPPSRQCSPFGPVALVGPSTDSSRFLAILSSP
jgi:hypothetical protein